MASTKAGPSSAWTLAFKDSGVSPGSTFTIRCTTMGPPSTSSVTKCTVQPLSVSPASTTAWCTSKSMPPACFGSKLGWMLIQRPSQSLQNSGLTIRMKPHIITSSTPASRRTLVTSASYSARGVPFLQGTCTVFTPSFWPLSKIPASFLFETTTTISAFSSPFLIVSKVSWEEEPRVEPISPMRSGEAAMAQESGSCLAICLDQT